MKVFYPYAYFYPETCAGTYLIDNVIEASAASGIESLMTVPTPTRDVDTGMSWRRTEKLYGGKFRIHRFHMYGEGKNPIGRAFRYLLCESIQLFYCLFKKYDVLFIDSTPPIQGLKLPLVKFLRRKPVIYNAQDLFPDSLVGTGLARKGGLLWRIGSWVMNITYRCCDKIIVISEDFKKLLLAKGVPEDKIVVVYNWVDQNAVVDIPRDKNKLFDKYQLDRSKFYIEYSGNIGLTQNMDMLLEVMKELKTTHPDIGLVLVGEGAYKVQVEEIVKRDNLTNVTMIPFQPYEDISYVFSLGDAGLVISKPGVGANSVPSKTWSIMSASRPVLANFDENELKDILAGNECGIFTKAGDKEAFTKSIIKLYENRELCKKYGTNGRQFVMDNLTREVGTQKYVDVIKEVCSGK